MRCDEVRQQMVAYLDGELDHAEREVIDIHLAGCSACRREMVGFESTDDLLGALGGAILPERDLAAAVLKQVKEGDPWCRHIRRELVAFADGELEAEEARPIEEHLAECDDCRAEHDLVVASGEALAAWTIREFTGDLVPRVVPARKSRRGVLRRMVPALAAACVVVIASVGVIVGTGGSNGFSKLEKAAIESGIGPELVTEENLRLLEEMEMLETLPELDEFAMLGGNGD